MNLLLIILIVTVLLLLMILFLPINIIIDTTRPQYALLIPGLVSISPQFLDEEFRLVIHIPFYTMRIDPFKKGNNEKVKKVKDRKQGTRLSRKQIWAIITSFKVKKFYLNIDTDDYLLNAVLTPVSLTARAAGLKAYINYHGQSDCVLHVSNNLYRIGKAYFLYT